MGIFSNMFKSKDKQTSEPIRPTPVNQTNQNMATFLRDDSGNIIVEYYDPVTTAREFYDTTKLVIAPNPVEIDGEKVYSAEVAWYGENDCFMLDENGENMGRRSDFKSIKLEIDTDKLYSDPMYQKVLMTQLLSRNRVNRYLQIGMEENPEHPCGNYVGRVSENYGKQFNPRIGKAVHNSPEMVEKRRIEAERKEEARQAQIAKKQEEMKRLQEEIDRLNK